MTPALVESLPISNGVSQGQTENMKNGVGRPMDTCVENASASTSSGQHHVPREDENPCLKVTADRTIKMSTNPVRAPNHDEVLLHVKCTGVCGSDIHFWHAGGIGPLRVQSDCVLGHEASGVVLRVGPSVKHVAVGDRVAIEPGVPCGDCYLCQQGTYNLCEDVQFAGVWPYEGTLQRFKCHPAKWVHKLPDNMSFAQGALLEPLSVVIHGIEEAGLKLGRGCVIHGAGPIGLIALAAARASGAHPIVVTDVEPKRLTFAKDFVPSCQTYLVNKDLDAQGNATEIRRLFGVTEGNEYSAPTAVLECTGIESSVCTAAYVARRGGCVMVIGVGKSIMNNLPFMHLSLAEIQLKFINRYRDTWPAGIAVLSGGILNLDKLVTHTFPLKEAVEALTFSSKPANGSIKVHITDDQDIRTYIVQRKAT